MESNLNAEKVRKITIERVEKFVSKEEWKDLNLFSKIYGPASSSHVLLDVWSVPDTDPNHTDKVTYARMKEEPESSFLKTSLGQTFSPEWSTHWVKVHVTLPEGWEGQEVHFVWDSTGEALLYKDGQPHQAFNGSSGNDRRDFHVLTKSAKAGDTWAFEIEMVSCGMFGNSNGAFLAPPNGTKVFTLKMAQIQVFNRAAYDLWTDLKILLEIAQTLPADDVRGWQAVECMRNVVNICHTSDETTWSAAAAMADEFLKQKNGEAQHQVMATGHCHIDTAWLWPYSETRRKVARSWATQCTIMDDHPEHVFTASQAQQFEWMKDLYPELFNRIKAKVREGQFVPIGGTWIEMDCNIPSGESFARQFLFGQKFFQRHFDGLTCKVFWLPDTFGYSSQLPQIMKQSECDFFLTQKLSWNNINKFPHNTFYWQGLDGTRVLSHFPPADTYVSEANVKDLVQGTKNFKTKDKSNRSMMLFGYGDGGGGPDPHHLARLSRLGDVYGVPKVTIGQPADYFNAVLADEETKLKKLFASNPSLSSLATSPSLSDIPKWVGELYFELHRGTYTTHARNKLGNRRSEFLLTSLELLTVLASSRPSQDSTKLAEIQRATEDMWKLVLLNQFHDVLPGTSIGLVYRDSDKHYQQVLDTCHRWNHFLLKSIGGGDGNAISVFNPLSWSRTALVELESPSDAHKSDAMQLSYDGRALMLLKVGGMSVETDVKVSNTKNLLNEIQACGAPALASSSSSSSTPMTIVGDSEGKTCTFVKIEKIEKTGEYVMENGVVRAIVDAYGRVISLVEKRLARESINPGQFANQFVMFEDIPFFWDAWDVELYHTEKPVKVMGYEGEANMKIIEKGPLRVGLEFSLAISKLSSLRQRIFLDVVSDMLTFETEVFWHENRKFLKVEFPLLINTNQVWYSTQFGCQARPNHQNTTWDLAKFEVCGHHWADLNEFGFGVALLNNSKYGYSCFDHTLRLSLLRSPKQPDDTADMGAQSFKYALLPHSGSHADALLSRRGLEFNVPLTLFSSAHSDYDNTQGLSKEDYSTEEAHRREDHSTLSSEEGGAHRRKDHSTLSSEEAHRKEDHSTLSSEEAHRRKAHSTLSSPLLPSSHSLFQSLDATSLILETVKLPEFDAGILCWNDTNSQNSNSVASDTSQTPSKWIILRLWESSGGRGTATFSTSLLFSHIVHVNILENPLSSSSKSFQIANNTFTVPYLPFEILTLACKLQ